MPRMLYSKKSEFMKNINRLIVSGILGTATMSGVGSLESGACTRVLYEGYDSIRVVGRSLDWRTPIPTNLYVYPAGMRKQGDNKPGCIEWTSKYGAVYAVSYDGGITEGMNEKGLVINGLFCKGTVYNNSDTEGRPPISLAVFVAWLLDMNATTDEVAAVLERHDFTIGGATFDGGTVSALHWGITDATGKTAILEFDHGQVKIHYPGDKLAMTNDPEWPSMNAIINYWDKIGGTHALPGTVSSPDRCVRANYFAHHVEKVSDPDLAVSICRSVLMPSCVPYTYTIEGEPNVSSTQWRSYSDIRDRRYFFDIATNMGYYYIDLKKCDLKKGAPVLKFNTGGNTGAVGDITSQLKASAPFNPMF